MKTFIALTLLSSIAATPAMAETFTRDGETYNYEIKQDAGVQLITGRNVSTGQEFVLRVRDGRVSGKYNGHSVNFAAVAKPEQLASR